MGKFGAHEEQTAAGRSSRSSFRSSSSLSPTVSPQCLFLSSRSSSPLTLPFSGWLQPAQTRALQRASPPFPPAPPPSPPPALLLLPLLLPLLLSSPPLSLPLSGWQQTRALQRASPSPSSSSCSCWPPSPDAGPGTWFSSTPMTSTRGWRKPACFPGCAGVATVSAGWPADPRWSGGCGAATGTFCCWTPGTSSRAPSGSPSTREPRRRTS